MYFVRICITLLLLEMSSHYKAG